MICLFVLISFQLIIRIYIFLTLIQASPPSLIFSMKWSMLLSFPTPVIQSLIIHKSLLTTLLCIIYKYKRISI